MKEFSFDKYRDRWLFSKPGKLPGGARLTLEPVQVIAETDTEGIANAIRWLRELDHAEVVKLEDLKSPNLGSCAKAVGCKSWATYIADTKFFLFRTEGALVRIFEIGHINGSHTGNNTLICEEDMTDPAWVNLIASCLSHWKASICPEQMRAPLLTGRQAAWISVQSTDFRRFIRELGVKKPKPCALDEGLDEATQEGRVFVSSSVSGWTFAIGVSLMGSGTRESNSDLESEAVRLSAVFGEAHVFGRMRVIEYYLWIKARSGAIDRSFAYSGERGEIVLSRGTPTAAEVRRGLVKEHFTPTDLNEDTLEDLANDWGAPFNLLASTDAVGKIGSLQRLGR